MVDPALGTKRTCPSCAARFYDLNKEPITCPACEASFVAPPILPSKQDQPAPEVAQPKAAEPVPDEAAKVTTMEAVDDPAASEDDETAAIAEVDLGEAEAVVDDDEPDGPFLETDDDDDPGVDDIIVAPTKDETD